MDRLSHRFEHFFLTNISSGRGTTCEVFPAIRWPRRSNCCSDCARRLSAGKPAPRQRAVGLRFARWVAAHQGEPWVLSLFDFANKRPLKYVYDDDIEAVIDLLEVHPAETTETLRVQARELSHAIHSLVSQGSSWGHEHLPSLSSPADYGEFEGIWNSVSIRGRP